MRFVIASIVIAVVFPGASAVAKRPHRHLDELHHTARQIGSLRHITWSCQDTLDAPRSKASVPVWALPRSVKYRYWVMGRWNRRALACQKALDARTIPYTNDWLTAVRLVQRVYPGTSGWLLYISHREGGHGQWVWYGGHPWRGYHIGDDTVGGNMQFRWSTFEPYWRQAQADLAARGFIIPSLRMPPAGGDPKYVAWLSPLGQALTAGYMRFTGKDACHWCLG